jgi:Methyltransferase domain
MTNPQETNADIRQPESRPSYVARLCAVAHTMRKEKRENPILIPFWRNLLLQPLPFFLWFRMRWHWYHRGGAPLTVYEKDRGAADHIARNVIPYSVRKMRGMDRQRTERLMNVVRSIHGVDVRNARVLNIGPRNEMEVLLLRLYGFSAENITAIDLFTYSPAIQVMDMHQLAFADDSFDLTYSAYTLRYSDDVERACCEIVRCTRHGGVVAASFVTDVEPPLVGAARGAGEREAVIGTRLSGGVADLLRAFGNACDHVYWREEYQIAGPVEPEKHCSVIFRVRKN